MNAPSQLSCQPPNPAARQIAQPIGGTGEPCRARTCDLLIKSLPPSAELARNFNALAGSVGMRRTQQAAESRVPEGQHA